MNEVERQLSMNDSTNPDSCGVDSAPDRGFEAAKLMMPYQFGSLWWGRDDLIKKAQITFTRRPDRIGHPLLSVKRGEFKSRNDMIPMLVGTSGTGLREGVKKLCVQIKGLTAEESDKICYFGAIIKPGLYGFGDLLDGIVRKANSFRKPAKHDKKAPLVASEPVPWYELRTMHPNYFKPHVDDGEKKDLELFCRRFCLGGFK